MYQFKLVAHTTDRGSTPGKPNEDGFVVTPTVFAMIDGATGRAKNGRRFIADPVYQSDAQWLTAATIQYLERYKLVQADLRDAIRTLARDLKTKFNEISCKYPDTERIEIPSAALGIARLHNDKLQATSLADITTLVLFKDGSHHLISGKTHPGEPELNRRVVSYQNEHLCSFSEALAANIDYMRKIANESNKPGCWGVLNTWDLPPDDCFGPYEEFDIQDVKQVMQYTDGLDDRFETFTLGDLISAASSNEHLETIISKIRAAEQADPNAKRIPRAKMSDDATIAVVDILPSP